MDLMYMNHDREDLGVLKNPAFDLAFGEDENNFECKISLKDHCCKEGYYIYAEGTEYGGIVDAIEIDSENDLAIYTGRSWHGILASKVIEPLKSTDEDVYPEVEETEPEYEYVSRLPEGFTEVEYIESDGNAYINSKINSSTSLTAIIDFQFTEYISDTWCFSVFQSATVGWRAGVYQEAFYCQDLTPSQTNILKRTTFTGACKYNISLPMFLFAENRNGTAYGKCKGRCYPSQMLSNGVAVRDYVPCTKTNGEAGLYDLVSASFFGNAGSGKFIAGPAVPLEKVPIPVPEPDPIVTLKRTDDKGESMLNRYLTISGDAGYCTKYIVDRIDIAPLFVAAEKMTDVPINAYQFDRYADAYTGLCAMLASCGMRLAIVCEESTVKISAVPIFDGSDGKEMESDLIEYQMKKTYNNVNHLICAGSGNYEDRQIVHLYLDADGNVSETQTFYGIEERIQFDGEQGEPEKEETRTAEQLAEERAQLIENGTKKLLDMQADDEIDVTFDSADDIYYIGDIVGAYDNTTDISVSAAVVKKIISIANSKTNIEYKVGAKNG